MFNCDLCQRPNHYYKNGSQATIKNSHGHQMSHGDSAGDAQNLESSPSIMMTKNCVLTNTSKAIAVPRDTTISHFPKPPKNMPKQHHLTPSEHPSLEYEMEFERWLKEKTSTAGEKEKVTDEGTKNLQNNDQPEIFQKLLIVNPPISQNQSIRASVLRGPSLSRSLDFPNSSKNQQFTHTPISTGLPDNMQNLSRSPEIICLHYDDDDPPLQATQNEKDAQHTSVVQNINSGCTQQQFVCKICGGIWSSFQTLREHLVKSHSDGTPFPCIFCPKVFLTLGLRQSHMRVHRRGWSYECKICHRFFAQSKFLREHMTTFHDTVLLMDFDTNQTKIQKCAQKTKKPSAFTFRWTPCEHCGIQLKGQKSHSNHQKLHRMGILRPQIN